MDQELAGAAAYAPADAVCTFTRRQHFPVWNDVVATIFIISKIRHCQLMHIYLKNNPARFHPNLIWNDTALGLCEEGHPSKNKNEEENNNKSSNDIESVPDPINRQK